MSEEELININGIREDLYQAMQIGDIILSSKHSQELYDFMNYQDKEIERLNNIINELEKVLYKRKLDNYDIYTANVLCDLQSDFNEILQELERSEKE